MKFERLKQMTIPPDATIRQAMAAIESGTVAIALVTDRSGVLLGVVTDGDIRRALLHGSTLDTPVTKLFSRNFRVVGPSAGRPDVLDLMRAQAIQQVPIVDDNKKLIGLHVLREIVGAVERTNWAVLMAGGRGKRLDPITEKIPKPMLPVAGRPILERLLLQLVGFGFRRVFMSVQHLGCVIQEHFGDGDAYGCRIEYLCEQRPLGTGGSLSLLPEVPSEPLLVMNGDLVADIDIQGLLDFHVQGGHVATVCTREYAHTVPYGVLEICSGRVRSMVEKPSYQWMTNAGVYVLDPCVVRRVPADTECTLPELLDRALADGESVGSFMLDRDWIDIGHFDQLRRAQGKEA